MALEAAERRAQIVEHGFEAAVQRGATAHYHIIMVGTHRCGVESLHEFAQTAANPVPFRGGADFFRNGESDAHRAIIIAGAGLYHKGGAGHARAIGRGEEIRALP